LKRHQEHMWEIVYKVQNIKSVRLPISGSNLHSRNIGSSLSLFTRSYQKTFVLFDAQKQLARSVFWKPKSVNKPVFCLVPKRKPEMK